MKIRRLFLPLVVLVFGAPVFAAGGLHLLGVEEQARVEPSPALVASQAATLEVLVPVGVNAADLKPRFVQIAGTIARPLALEAEVLPHPMEDARIARIRFTPPAVTRVTRLLFWLGEFGPQPVTVFPAGERREDLASLADALHAACLRLVVCGGGAELRAWLRSQALDFEDLGRDAPSRLSGDELLLGDLRAEDWARLADARGAGHVLAFMDEPALSPGVYVQRDPAGVRHLAKITLPLFPLLATDPRARDTLHTLLLQALPAARP